METPDPVIYSWRLVLFVVRMEDNEMDIVS